MIPKESWNFGKDGDSKIDGKEAEKEMKIEQECLGGKCDGEIQRTHVLDYKVS